MGVTVWVGQKLGQARRMLRTSATRARTWVGRRTVWLILRSLRWVQWAFFVIAIIALWFGYHLQEKAFPQSAPSPFSQVSATVYTRINPSRVLLKLWIAPNASQKDLLEITVKGPQGKPDPWLLVVTCPRHVAGKVEMQLVGTGVTPQSQYVLASVHDRSHKLLPLRCVSGPAGQDGAAQPVVGTGRDVNLSLPVLEQVPLGQSAIADTPVYVLRGPPDQTPRPNLPIKPNLPIARLMQVFQAPGSTCQAPGVSATPSPGPSATTTGAPASTSGGSTPSASPSAGAPAGTPGNACSTPLPAGVIATKYNIPTSVATSEILENVSLSGDRIDSMFPPGQITSNNQVIWQGVSGLSPDLSATSLTNDENASRDGFFAGLCYGLAAGLFVPFLQGVSDAHEKIRKERRSAQDEGAGAQGDPPLGRAAEDGPPEA